MHKVFLFVCENAEWQKNCLPPLLIYTSKVNNPLLLGLGVPYRTSNTSNDSPIAWALNFYTLYTVLYSVQLLWFSFSFWKLCLPSYSPPKHALKEVLARLVYKWQRFANISLQGPFLVMPDVILPGRITVKSTCVFHLFVRLKLHNVLKYNSVEIKLIIHIWEKIGKVGFQSNLWS